MCAYIERKCYAQWWPTKIVIAPDTDIGESEMRPNMEKKREKLRTDNNKIIVCESL